jgi:hypothetical protein
VAVAGGLEPGVVGVAIDFFLKRIKDAQPGIGSKTCTGDRHNNFFFLVEPVSSGCRKKIDEPNTAFSRCLTGRDVARPLQGKCAEMGIISEKIT